MSTIKEYLVGRNTEFEVLAHSFLQEQGLPFSQLGRFSGPA